MSSVLSRATFSPPFEDTPFEWTEDIVAEAMVEAVGVVRAIFPQVRVGWSQWGGPSTSSSTDARPVYVTATVFGPGVGYAATTAWFGPTLPCVRIRYAPNLDNGSEASLIHEIQGDVTFESVRAGLLMAAAVVATQSA
jgi:hypothetical protein